MTTLDVLMTSHNRCAKTLACLASLADQHLDADVQVVLVDAASQDGTREQVAATFPDTVIVPVGKDVFWGQGMRIAGERGAQGRRLPPVAERRRCSLGFVAARLLRWGRTGRIVVGKAADDRGSETYGGLVAGKFSRLSLRPVPVSRLTGPR